MLQEWADLADELFRKAKSPYEKMHDGLVGEDTLEDRARWHEYLLTDSGYTVHACKDFFWHTNKHKDIWVMIGQKIPCYICGRTNTWRALIDMDDMKLVALVCDKHAPTLTAFGYIRTVCTIRGKFLQYVLEREVFPPAEEDSPPN